MRYLGICRLCRFKTSTLSYISLDMQQKQTVTSEHTASVPP